jgi:hypothetical protein
MLRELPDWDIVPLLQQALTLKAAAAKAAMAASLTNFMKNFPSFPCWLRRD